MKAGNSMDIKGPGRNGRPDLGIPNEATAGRVATFKPSRPDALS